MKICRISAAISLVGCALLCLGLTQRYRIVLSARPAVAGNCTLPLTDTYTSGSSAELICTNATSLTVEVWGAGGAGGLRSASVNAGGGGGGGYSSKTISTGFSGGGTISYSVADTTPGNVADDCSNGFGGSASTAGGVSQLVNMTANGGGGGTITPAGGAGGTASGGDTNTTGTAGASGGAGGAGASGGAGGATNGGNGTAPGGGGGGNKDGTVCGNGFTSGSGARGQVKFTWN